jgi:hypothetical protein
MYIKKDQDKWRLRRNQAKKDLPLQARKQELK